MNDKLQLLQYLVYIPQKNSMSGKIEIFSEAITQPPKMFPPKDVCLSKNF